MARQLRLRDLAGLIVIDFIDMDERRNNASVEKRLKDKLKTDRARIQVGRISGFGLLEMSRQRLRPGMIEATTQPCQACHGTGLIRSDDSLALSILRQIEEEGVRRRSREVLVKCPVGIANYLMNQKRDHVAQIEGRYGLSVRIEGDPRLVSPDFTMEKFKTATRNVPEVPMAQFVSGTSALMDDIDDEVEDEIEEEAETETGDEAKSAPGTGGEGGDKPKKSRRRRSRRRKPKNGNGAERNGEGSEEGHEDDEAEGADAAEQTREGSVAEVVTAPATETATQVSVDAGEEAVSEEKPKPKRTRAPRKKKEPAAAEEATSDEAAKPKAAEKPKRTPTPRKKKAPEAVAVDETSMPTEPEAAAAVVEAEPVAEAAPEPVAEVTPEPVVEVTPEPVADAETPEAEPAPEPVAETPAPQEEPKPKRRGWWSLG